MTILPRLSLSNLQGDLYGGITAAVVALPLALAFGVASGAGASAGLYGAIFVGLFASLFGGTPSQVSGPTGPMTVAMAAVFTQYASEPGIAIMIIVLGGALQILFGAIKIGRYVTYVPFKVISGFMSGIGCIIIIVQLAPLMGQETSTQGVLHALSVLPDQIALMASHLAEGPGDPYFQALILGIVSLMIVTLTPSRLRKWVPSPLLALALVTVLGVMLLPAAPTIGEIPRGLPSFHMPSLTLAALPNIISSALLLALLGSIDSLLTSLVADNMTRSRHNSDQELFGQGLGNIIAGLFGGIPGAGATMRTAINIRAGGRTALSGALHALVLAAIVLALAPLAEHIPLALLAGILLKVGWDIIDWGTLRRLSRLPRSSAVVMLAVLALTVFADLVTAVGVGIIMASLISARQLSEQQLSQMQLVSSESADIRPLPEEERNMIQQTGGRVLLFRLSGPFSFCSANELSGRLGGIGGSYKAVIFDLTDSTMIDLSIAMALEQMVRQARESGIVPIISGLGSGPAALLERLGTLDTIPASDRHASRADALTRALEITGVAAPA